MKELIKKYLEKKKYHSSCTSYTHLIKIFPNINEFIKLDDNLNFSGQLYCYINNIKYPICNKCGEPYKFISFKKGFLKNCNNKCDKKIIIYNGKEYKIENNNVKVCSEHGTIITYKTFITGKTNNVECFCEKCSSKIRSLNLLDENQANKSKEFIKKLYLSRKMPSEDYIKIYFPNLFLKINSIKVNPNTFKNKLNQYINNYDLKCKNKDCNNQVSFDKSHKPKEYCEDCNRKKAIRTTKDNFSKEYWIEYIKNYFNTNVKNLEIKDKNIIIHDYCKHYNILEIKKSKIKFLKKQGIYSLCEECNKEYYLNNISDINSDVIKNNWNNIKMLSYESLMNNNPYIWAYIIKHMKDTNSSFQESKYMINYNINKKPKCLSCDNDALFSNEAYAYLDHCKEHLYDNYVSKGEIEIKKYLDELNIKYESNIRNLISKELDIYIPSKNLAIEFNGLYWHSELFKNKNYHYEKMKECQENNIQLITIWEDDWNNKQDIIKSIIKNKLGLIENRIYARETNINLVDNKEKSDFLLENHLQGNSPSHINLGLYYNNELVSLLTLGKKRMILNSLNNKEYHYELMRFCNKKNINVIGGASKLFSYFVKNYNPISIISYANCDISEGNLYDILQFKFVNHTGVNYWWFKNGIKYHRSNFMKHKLIKEGYDNDKSESDIMHERGYLKIWGSGNLKYEWKP